jgi:hypothetical protein
MSFTFDVYGKTRLVTTSRVFLYKAKNGGDPDIKGGIDGIGIRAGVASALVSKPSIKLTLTTCTGVVKVFHKSTS